MFERLYCHIGAHKTATSSIQGTMWHSDKALRARGIYNIRQPAGLLAQVSNTPHTLVPIRMRNLFGEQVQRFADLAMQKLDRAAKTPRLTKALFSTEHALTLNAQEIAGLAQLLMQRAQHVTVIYYVRHPIGRIASYLSQEVKTGHARLNHPLTAYLEDTEAVLAPWIDAFGRTSIDVRAFDPTSMPHGEPVADFCHAIQTPELFPDLDLQRKNTGITHAGTLIADAMNADGKTRRGRQQLINVLELMAGPKLTIPTDTLNLLRPDIEKNLRYVQREFGITLPHPTLAEHEIDLNEILNDAALAEIGQVLLHLAQQQQDLQKTLKRKQLKLQKLTGTADRDV